MRNLKDIEFHEKQAITVAVESRINNPKNNAYDLSKLILMAGLLGNNKLYQEAYNKLIGSTYGYTHTFPVAIDESDRASVTAWLYGCISFAAYCMEFDGQAREFNKHIERLLPHCTEPTKDCVSWARSYQAISAPKGYYDAEKLMEAAYDKGLWSWMLVIYAAAHQHDEDTYNTGWLALNRQFGAEDVSRCFTPKNSSQAWALAMLLGAAQLMNDTSAVAKLTSMLRTSIAHPETSSEDKILAQLTFQLAKERTRAAAGPDSMSRSVYQYARGLFSAMAPSEQMSLRYPTSSPK